MPIESINCKVAMDSRLGWKDYDLEIVDGAPDEAIYLQAFGSGKALGRPRIISGAASTIRLPVNLLAPFLSLTGVKSDESKAYIALGINAASDLSIILTAVDETGGGGGGGTGDLARIAGTVTIDGTAGSRQIVIVDDDPAGRKVVGAGQSAQDGTFDIEYDDTGFPVIAIAIDQYGQGFQAEAVLNEGAVVHPTAPNGYVYEVSSAGTTGETEPAWSTTQSVQSGSVTFIPRPYYRPIASGPLEGEPVVPE